MASSRKECPYDDEFNKKGELTRGEPQPQDEKALAERSSLYYKITLHPVL
jgi:hypothetical protein